MKSNPRVLTAIISSICGVFVGYLLSGALFFFRIESTQDSEIKSFVYDRYKTEMATDTVWFSDGTHSVETSLVKLFPVWLTEEEAIELKSLVRRSIKTKSIDPYFNAEF